MDRFSYKNSPLIEVIIQLRFPTILSLNANDPVEFQEAIRNNYPIYQLMLDNLHDVSFVLGQGGNESSFPTFTQRRTVKNHNFISEDGKYKINLTCDFISISTVGYICWEQMLEHFRKPLQVFEKIYSPSFYERVGLRYIDAYSRSKLNLSEISWRELIKPPWLGAFAVADDSGVLNTEVNMEYVLNNGISVAKLHAGLGNVNNEEEQVFIFDEDIFHPINIKTPECFSILEYLHDNAKSIVRTVVSDKLHKAMCPEEIK